MKTIIHVNQHNIKRNRQEGLNLPVLTVKTYNSNIYAHRVKIDGPSEVVYQPESPLSCGAHVWIETQSNVEIIGEGLSFNDVKEQIKSVQVS